MADNTGYTRRASDLFMCVSVAFWVLGLVFLYELWSSGDDIVVHVFLCFMAAHVASGMMKIYAGY